MMVAQIVGLQQIAITVAFLSMFDWSVGVFADQRRFNKS